MSVVCLPIRHHGPGSARAVQAALDALRPDAVVVEGPPEAEALLPWVGQPSLVPPVAMLVFLRHTPARSLAYPLASWSPEWVALRWAAQHRVPVRFADLAAGHRLAHAPPATPSTSERLGQLAHIAGFDSPDAWWEWLVETRTEVSEVFEAVRVAMAAAREPHAGRYGVRADPQDDPLIALREACMRQVIRAVVKSGSQRTAVVCGAWHAPALADLGGVGDDRALLRGLPKAPVDVAWIPWTTELLGGDSGYGAGVESPGWAACCADGPEDREARWVSRWSFALRDSGASTSAAQSVDAVCLARQLADLRQHTRCEREDLDDAVAAIFDAAAVATVRPWVLFGDAIGRVPADAPAVPLLKEVRSLCKQLRLPMSAKQSTVQLDLRQVRGLDKSRLLHQLAVLQTGWATRQASPDGALGTFHEVWTLRWSVSCERALVAASPWGVTPSGAASAHLIARCHPSQELPTLVADVDRALLAGLPQALDALLVGIDQASVRGADRLLLLEQAPALATAATYGSVRGGGAAVAEVARRLIARGLAGLVSLSVDLDDEFAQRFVHALMAIRAALSRLTAPSLDALWRDTLLALCCHDDAHARVRGVAARLLSDAGEPVCLAQWLSRALADPVVERAAAWLEGLIAGSAQVFVFRPELWRPLDAWLVALPEDAFERVLPVLRRSMSSLDDRSRRQLADAVAAGGVKTGPAPDYDARRAHTVQLGLERWLLGPLPVD